MAFRQQRNAPWLNYRLFWLICVLYLSFSQSISAQPADPQAETEEVDRTELEARISALRDVQSAAEKTPFDLESLIEHHDYELERLISYVKQHIQYEMYEGSLRGASGALVSQAGNSLDQSALLASIINDIGYEARIAAGTLSADDSRALTTEQNNAIPMTGTPGLAELERSLEPFSSTRNPPVSDVADTSVRPAWLDALDRTANDIKAEVRNVMPLAAGEQNQATEASYYCVQYRDSAAGGWKTIHPAFTAADESIGFTPESAFADAIPEELLHRISFQVHLDRKTRGASESVAITPVFTYPTANQEALSWTYVSVPDGFLQLEEWTPQGVHDALMSSDLFIPQVNASPIGDGNVFDVLGNVVPLPEAMSRYGALFATVGGKFDDIANATSGLATKDPETSEPVRYTSRIWLEILLISPGGETQRFERTLAEWAGDREAFYRQLAKEVTITVETGHPSFIQFVRQLSRAQSNVLEVLLPPEKRSNEGDQQILLEDAKFLASIDGNLFYLFSDLLSDHLSGVERYRFQPSVVARYRSSLVFDPANQGFDIITMARRAASDTERDLAFNAEVRNGVIDTLVEAALIARSGPLSESSFERLVVNHRAPSLEINPTLSADASLPYWQVDTKTGGTIGRLPNGWGGVKGGAGSAGACFVFAVSATEYVEQLIASATQFWGPRALGQIQFCGSLTMAMAVSTQVTAGADLPGLEDFCDQVPDDTISALCHATLIMLQAVDLFTKTEAGQKAIKRILRTFFTRCLRFLRTGSL